MAEGRYSLYRPDLREVETGPVLGEDGRAVPMVILADLVQGQWFRQADPCQGWMGCGAARRGRVTLARTDLGVISLFEEVTLDLAWGASWRRGPGTETRSFGSSTNRTGRSETGMYRGESVSGMEEARSCAWTLEPSMFSMSWEDRVRRLDLPPGTVIREKGPGLSM